MYDCATLHQGNKARSHSLTSVSVAAGLLAMFNAMNY